MRILSLLSVFVFSMSMLFAQEYTIKYSMDMKSDDPQIQAQLGMMRGSTLTMYVKDGMSRSETNMGGFMTTTNIMDPKKKKGIMLMDGMMGKTASPFDLDDVKEESDDSGVEVELLNETKTILGYKCKKAVVTTGDDVELVYWYTDQIKMDKEAMGKYVRGGIPGLPLEFEMDQGNMTMKFTASEFSQKVKVTKDMFSTKVPKGFTEKSIDDVMKSAGGI